MNDLTINPSSFGAVPSVFAGHRNVADELAAGVNGGFGHIGYKGKAWAIRYNGNEQLLMRDDGDGPRNSIEVVILKGAAAVSKIYYEGQFVEGSHAAPDCFSTNGVTPDAGAQHKQHTVCATCAKNAWGSRITNAGKQGKACSDSRRLAVVPLGDIKNEIYGGPLLLRVPAASLKDLAAYSRTMDALGYPYYAIGTRVAFDPNEAYPKFVFSGIRALTEAEAKQVLAWREDALVTRILAEGTDGGEVQTVAPAAALASAFEQPPAPAAMQLTAPAPVVPQTTPPTATVGDVVPSTVSSGFGPVATSQPAPQATQAPATVTPAAAVSPVQSPQNDAAPTGAMSFDEALDAKMEELLPS